MPDQRRHRGPHPEDARLFPAEQTPRLQAAVRDLSWLLSRAYAPTSALKLVGDRYQLTARQRMAVGRCACGDQQRADRTPRRQMPSALQAAELWIDGYNVLTTVEAALSGGVIIRGRDGCLRDMASMHGSYREVTETQPAIHLIGNVLQNWQVAACRWLLDQPVSNSGRLRGTLLSSAAAHGWNWTVDLVPNPDRLLRQSPFCVATADSQILDLAAAWVALANAVIERSIPQAWILDLSGDAVDDTPSRDADLREFLPADKRPW